MVMPLLLLLLRGVKQQGHTVAFAIAVLFLVTLTRALALSPALAALVFGLMARHRRISISRVEQSFGTLGHLLSALACYLQTLCAYLLAHQELRPIEDDYLVYQYNRFQACRFGLDGILVHPKTYRQVALREDLFNTLCCIEPYSGVLVSQLALERINQITHADNDAQYLRQQFARLGNVESVVNAALKKFSAH